MTSSHTHTCTHQRKVRKSSRAFVESEEFERDVYKKLGAIYSSLKNKTTVKHSPVLYISDVPKKIVYGFKVVEYQENKSN